ncbi:MAG: hypothetical protein AB1505_16870 [Candidatus Latescibacterota bacterium]
MARIDLRKFALRLKVIEMVKLYARQRMVEEARTCWRRYILPN